MNAVLLGLTSAICIALANFCGGLASRRDASITIGTVGQLITVPIIATLLAVVHPTRVSFSDVAWGAAAGVSQILGVRLLWRAMSSGTMGALNAINALTAAIVPAAWILTRGERLGGMARCGVALAAVSLVLVTRNPKETALLRAHQRHVAEAAVAGSLFGLGFVALTVPSPAATLLPLLAMRVTASVLGLGLVWRAGEEVWPSSGNRRVGLLPGVFGGTSLVCFVVAAHIHSVAIVSVLQGLAPVVTAVLAYRLLHQHLRRSQAVGLGLAVIATALVVG